MKSWKKSLFAVLLCALGAIFTLGAVACGGKKPAKDPNICTVTFELCTPEGLTTNVVAPKEVKKGSTVTKPIVAVLSDNPNNSEVDAWYTDREYTNKWSFLVNKVEEDITLYAKWVDNHSVTYYLGLDATTPMFTEQYRDGDSLKVMKELSDGYKCNGFFYEDGTEVVDGVPVTGPLNIYIDRSEEIYFSASMIANRFTPVASGGAGSTAGTLTLEGEGEDAYAKANFGYATSPGDAFMHLKNVTLDITASQTLRVTFKNLGKATSLKFYFVIWYADETPVVQNYFTEETTYTYRYKPEEIEMSPEAEWIVADFDIAAQNIMNGVSLWGNAATLVQLRMQSTYVSADENDLSNEVWIKSIEGIKDLTHVGTDDTQAVQALQKDDDKAAIDAVAATQEEVSGWVFPKNFAEASVESKKDENDNEIAPQVAIYNKTDGLLMRSEYRAKETSVVLTVPEGKTINLDDLTTIRLRLKNLGYATSIIFKYETSLGRSGEREVAIDPRMSETKEYVVNMFDSGNKYSGDLASITITYNSVGNDNAILLESVIFDEFMPLQIPGFNFNDKHAFGIESSSTLKAEYDSKKDGTKFTVLENGASFEKAFNSYSMLGYEEIELRYVLEEEYENENGKDVANGITKAIVELYVNGVSYAHEFVLKTDRASQNITLPLKMSGYVEKLKVTFEGVGVIYIQEIRFNLEASRSVDFGSSGTYNMMLSDWKSTLSYNGDVSAVLYTPQQNANGHNHSFNWYIGYKAKETGIPNIPLGDKDKIVIIYQNRNSTGYINLGIGHVDDRMEEYAEDYQTAYRYPSGSGGSFNLTGLKTNMADNEWASCEFDLSELYMTGGGTKVTATDLAHLHLSTIFVTPSVSMYVRAVIVTKAVGNVVSFEMNAPEDVEVEELEDQFVKVGMSLAQPSIKLLENPNAMQIVGWYTDEACTQAWDFDNEVTKEMTLYAKWGELQAENLVGFNFGDKKAGGFAATNGLELAYNDPNKGTKFIVSTNGATTERGIDYQYSIFGYATMKLTYAMAGEGITAITVTLTTDGIVATYTYDVTVTEGVTTLSQDLTAKGDLEKIAISFTGTGEVIISSLTFGVGEGVDFSEETPFMIGDSGWMRNACRFDENLKAVEKYKTGVFKFYLGAMYTSVGYGEGNISFEGKNKIIIVYQNRGAAQNFNVGVGITSTKGAGWETVTTEGSTGGYRPVSMQGNMTENEWAVLAIDVTTLKGVTEATKADWALTSITIEGEMTFSVRAVTVI